MRTVPWFLTATARQSFCMKFVWFFLAPLGIVDSCPDCLPRRNENGTDDTIRRFEPTCRELHCIQNVASLCKNSRGNVRREDQAKGVVVQRRHFSKQHGDQRGRPGAPLVLWSNGVHLLGSTVSERGKGSVPSLGALPAGRGEAVRQGKWNVLGVSSTLPVAVSQPHTGS